MNQTVCSVVAAIAKNGRCAYNNLLIFTFYLIHSQFAIFITSKGRCSVFLSYTLTFFSRLSLGHDLTSSRS